MKAVAITFLWALGVILIFEQIVIDDMKYPGFFVLGIVSISLSHAWMILEAYNQPKRPPETAEDRLKEYFWKQDDPDWDMLALMYEKLITSKLPGDLSPQEIYYACREFRTIESNNATLIKEVFESTPGSYETRDIWFYA